MNILKRLFSIDSDAEICPPSHLLTTSYPGDYSLNKLESTIPKDSSKHISAFLAILLLKKMFFKINSIHSYIIKLDSLLWPHPITKGHIKTTSNHHYPRILPHRFKLSWLIGLREDL